VSSPPTAAEASIGRPVYGAAREHSIGCCFIFLGFESELLKVCVPSVGRWRGTILHGPAAKQRIAGVYMELDMVLEVAHDEEGYCFTCCPSPIIFQLISYCMMVQWYR
jgi:hypothetical protein